MTRSAIRGAAAMALAVASALGLVSCASTGEPAPPAPTSSQLRGMLAAWSVDQANAYANGSPYQPVVAHFIRFASYTEWPAVMKRCTASLGVTDMVFTSDHSTGLALNPTSDQFQRDRAYRTCTIQYPPVALRARFKTAEQLDYIYDWYVNESEPCFRSLGVTITGLPSRQQFREQSHNGLSMWSPFDNLPTGSQTVNYVMTASGVTAVPAKEAMSAVKLSVLRSKCPVLPPGMSQ